NDIQVYLCNRPEPTPVVSYSVLDRKAGGGVVITSSHNPAPYNGFKYKPEYAGSASPEIVAKLEARIRALQASGGVRRLALADAVQQGQVERIDARTPYVAQMGRLEDLE